MSGLSASGVGSRYSSSVRSSGDAVWREREKDPDPGDESGQEPSRKEGPPMGGERHVNFGSVGNSSGSRGGREPQHGVRDDRKRGERRREGKQDGGKEDLTDHPLVTVVSSETTSHTITPSHPHTPHTNIKAIFGPPVDFGPAPSSSKSQKAATTRDTTRTKAPTPPPVPSTAPAPMLSSAHKTGGRSVSSLQKIDIADGERELHVICHSVGFSLLRLLLEPHPLISQSTRSAVLAVLCCVVACLSVYPHILPADTLATLRSKVEAQKLALEATHSRLQSLRQSSVTSEPCIYPLPEGKAQSSSIGLLIYMN